MSGLGGLFSNSLGNSSVAYLVIQNGNLECGEPRCGYNTKHQVSEAGKIPDQAQTEISCSSRQPRSVYHPPWPDMLGCIWYRSERAPSAVESVEIAERDQMLGGASRSCWGPDGIQEPVEATGGSENSVAQYLPIRLLF